MNITGETFRNIEKLIGNLPKSNEDTLLKYFKLFYFLAITIGIIWNLLYFGFIIKILPSFDSATVIGYIISISGVGFIILIAFSSILAIPGFIGRTLISEQAKEELKSDESKLYSKLLYIIPLPTISISLISFLWHQDTLKLIISSAIFVAIEVAILLCILPIKKGWDRFHMAVSSIYFSITSFFFLLIPFLVVPKADKMTMSLSILYIGIFVLLPSAFINSLILLKGLSFTMKADSSFKDASLSILMIFSVLIVLILTLGTILGEINKEKTNPFLTAPFKLLKIGQINAKLSLDDDFVKKAQLREKCYLPEQCQTTFKFNVLSNIGSEYIVKYPAGELSHAARVDIDCEEQLNKFRVLRIPKDKILLIEYDD